MLKIKFKYKDAYSKGKWNEQECIMRSVQDCIRTYGLGVDCDYEILSIEDLDKRKADKDFLEDLIDEQLG